MLLQKSQNLLSWIAASALLMSCSPEAEREAAQPPVQTFTLASGAQEPFRRFPGVISAANTSRMSFDVAGRLIEFPATQGLVVKKDDLLGRLDDTNFVASADSARADFTAARDELARRRQLRERGVISQSELDQFQQQFEVAQAALRTAERAVADTRMVAPFDGRVASTLVNNFQNVQAKEPVLVFQNVSTLEVDIQIPESDMALAEQGVTAENARERLEANVEFATLPGRTFDLELKSFSTEATPSARTFRVTFNLTPPEGQNILPGMTCTVQLRRHASSPDEPAASDVFRVPVSTVSTSGSESSVWTINPETSAVTRVPVTMLDVTETFIDIQSDKLKEGDQLVSSGVRFLEDGMTVRPMPTPAR